MDAVRNAKIICHMKAFEPGYYPAISDKEDALAIINALQEQAEREKGCDLCSLTFDSADQLILELKKDGYGDCTICPRCGRDLRKPVE